MHALLKVEIRDGVGGMRGDSGFQEEGVCVKAQRESEWLAAGVGIHCWVID